MDYGSMSIKELRAKAAKKDFGALNEILRREMMGSTC